MWLGCLLIVFNILTLGEVGGLIVKIITGVLGVAGGVCLIINRKN